MVILMYKWDANRLHKKRYKDQLLKLVGGKKSLGGTQEKLTVSYHKQ